MPLDNQSLTHRYRTNGFLSPVSFLTSAWELASMPKVLDLVEKILEPDILLFNVTYIIKDPNALSHVSWHQDLTYWGLSHDDQVSMWMALSPTTQESGCMRMLPGSHKEGRQKHEVAPDETNVLLQGQTVKAVDEETAILCPLKPGEATFHHGWTLHASMPNKSHERRIGLNVQYLATHVRQTKHENDSAVLVRGQDKFNHLTKDIPAKADLEPKTLKRQEELERLYN